MTSRRSATTAICTSSLWRHGRRQVHDGHCSFLNRERVEDNAVVVVDAKLIGRRTFEAPYDGVLTHEQDSANNNKAVRPTLVLQAARSSSP
jgi:hypothetical protein